jgi:hypothetical protein
MLYDGLYDALHWTLYISIFKDDQGNARGQERERGIGRHQPDTKMIDMKQRQEAGDPWGT